MKLAFLCLALLVLAGQARADCTASVGCNWTYKIADANLDDLANMNVACWATDPTGKGLGTTLLLPAPGPTFTFQGKQVITNAADYGPKKSIVMRCVSYRTGTDPNSAVGANRSPEVSSAFTFPVANAAAGSLSHD